MKIIVAFVMMLLCVSISYFYFFSNFEIGYNKNLITKPTIANTIKNNCIHKMNGYAKNAHAFVHKNDYDTNVCFLIDMQLPSGKKRFFIYDFANGSVSHSGLVTHGGGSVTNSDTLVFNNVPNAHATSLGKYKVGQKYQGKFGTAYKLYGLENSNSKAFDRFVVLHAHACVPNKDIYPAQLCTSHGCPTVSPSFLNILEPYLYNSTKPILLWIYY